MEGRSEGLASIAEKIFDEEGQEIVTGYLDEGDEDSAAICILSALDSLYRKGKIDHGYAKKCYGQLGLSPARIERIRNSNYERLCDGK